MSTDRKPGFNTLADPCRSAARSCDRRAGHSDLSDHVLRVRRRRSRRGAVQPPDVRQHLYAHHQSDPGGARGAGCGAGGRDGRACVASGHAAQTWCSTRCSNRATNSSRRASSMADRSTSSRTPSRSSAGTCALPTRPTRKFVRARADTEDQGDLHRVRSPIRAASSSTFRPSPRSPRRPAFR